MNEMQTQYFRFEHEVPDSSEYYCLFLTLSLHHHVMCTSYSVYGPTGISTGRSKNDRKILAYVGWLRLLMRCVCQANHDDVIKWKHVPRYWPFVRGIHRSPVNSPHKGQWRGALMFSLICVWIIGWVNNREAGDLKRYRAHYDVIVMNVATKPTTIPDKWSPQIWQGGRQPDGSLAWI